MGLARADLAVIPARHQTASRSMWRAITSCWIWLVPS